MAKAVGIDSGAYELKIVELDGSFRRPKLSKVCIERTDVPSVGEDAAAVAATQVREVLKEAGMGRDNLAIAFPSNRTVLREMTVPFVGKEQIRRVIKFEAEGEIHSHSVDDLVVDFHILEELENETRVLIAAVPKADPLRTRQVVRGRACRAGAHRSRCDGALSRRRVGRLLRRGGRSGRGRSGGGRGRG